MNNFEEYLQEQHAKQFVGTKDMMIDDFNDWIVNLSSDEWIELSEQHINQNYIHKSKVMEREDIAQTLFSISIYLEIYGSWDKLPGGCKDVFLKQADALLSAGSIRKEVGAGNIEDLIINNKITSELVEKHFPKGQCKERGNAIVLHAEMLIGLAQKIYDEMKGEQRDG